MSWCLFGIYRVDFDQRAIIGPGTKFHGAVLQVEGKVEHDDLTVALVDGWRVPSNHPSVLQQHFGLVHDGKVTICTAGTKQAGAQAGVGVGVGER